MARKDAKLVDRIKANIKSWDDLWRTNNEQYYDQQNFINGDQWRDEEAKVFETYKKIPLSANKLAPLANYLLGEQRQNTVSIECIPDEDVPADAIDTREALIHEITFSSDAKVVFQIAFQQAIIGGFGAFYVDTEYENDYSFEQNIRIKAYYDPTRSFFDPASESPTKTDGMFSGRRTRMSRQYFKNVYGESLERKIGNDTVADYMVWSNQDSIMVVDYYERVYDTETLYLMSDGSSISGDELKLLELVETEDQKYYVKDGMPMRIEQKREAPRYTIKHYKVAGEYILEEGEFPTKTMLPLIFVDQNSWVEKDGRQRCRPFFKDAVDSQRYMNYIRTQSAYLLKISRYDQFIAPKSCLKGEDTRAIWRDPMNVQGALIFDDNPGGERPQRLDPPELSQSLTQQYMLAMEDIQSSTGIYNTQIGEQANERSGVAVERRTKQASYNTFVAFDALNRAVTVCAQIIDEMIPTVYDTQRSMQLSMKDKGRGMVTLNQQQDIYGAMTKNDMTKGRMKIRMQAGPSYEGQKEDARESMERIFQADPETFKLLGDLYAETLPLSNNIEIRNRVRTIIPPQVIEAGKTGEPLPPAPPQQDPQMMIAQMNFQIQQGELQLKAKDLELKEMDIQARIREGQQDAYIEMEKLQGEKMKLAAEVQDQTMRYLAETGRTEADREVAHAEQIVKLLTAKTGENRNARQSSRTS